MCYLLSYSNKLQCFTSFLYELMFCQMTEISILFLKSTLPSILLIMLPWLELIFSSLLFILFSFSLFFVQIRLGHQRNHLWCNIFHLLIINPSIRYRFPWLILIGQCQEKPQSCHLGNFYSSCTLFLVRPYASCCSLRLILKMLHSCEQFYCHLFTEVGLVHSMPMYIHGLPLLCFFHHV